MGFLYNARVTIDKAIASRGLNATVVRGTLGLKTGILFALIGPETFDDPIKVEKLTKAAKEVLGIQFRPDGTEK